MTVKYESYVCKKCKHITVIVAGKEKRCGRCENDSDVTADFDTIPRDDGEEWCKDYLYEGWDDAARCIPHTYLISIEE